MKPANKIFGEVCAEHDTQQATTPSAREAIKYWSDRAFAADDEITRLKTGLETIERYTGDGRHPNGIWDAHVIAGRLLRGEDQNGRCFQSDASDEPAR